MKIGFDLDGVFINKPYFIPKYIIERLYRTGEKVLNYRFPNNFEILIRKISHNPIFRSKIKDNIKFINELSRTKNSLFLISSRFSFLKKETEELIIYNGFNKIFKGIYINYLNAQPHIFKDEVIKKNKINIYIDDDFLLIKFLAKENKQTKFYWLNKNINKKITKNLLAITKLSYIILSL
ncbi:MAG: hypothetical protein EXS44_00820 [Candidatus Levybacteria bacterium]|nr:hypothetical protein [Candidatus Levybacteria bacterium]